MLHKFKFNIIYLLLPLALYFIFQITWDSKKSTVTFYGFAENKETELNFDKSVIVENVHITPGAFVQHGDTLLTLSLHSEIEMDLNDVKHEIQSLQVDDDMRRDELAAEIRKLEAEKSVKRKDIQSEIDKLQSEIDLNRSILSELKSIDTGKIGKVDSPHQAQQDALRRELQYVNQPYDAEIAKLNIEISQIGKPSNIQIRKLTNEAGIRKKEEEKIHIIAPTDGLVGNVHCKIGENISSFNTLISFYERNPTLVKGYVHENLIVQVEVGDTVEVISTYHPDNYVKGRITGLGSRIVEIPERLRKLPEIKTYGREVSIELPSVNSFLQKEKVVLNLLTDTDVSSIKKSFQRPSSTTEKKDVDLSLNQ